MYADNTTVYCTGETADKAIAHLNAALQEFHAWCLNNRLTPRPGKSEVMLLSKGTLMGQIARNVTKARLLGLTVDQKLSWVPHVLETKGALLINWTC